MNQDLLRIEWLDKKDRHSMYAKYALMELAHDEEIDFVKIRPSNFDQNILSTEKQDALLRSQSFFVARRGQRECKVILDCAESYIFLSPAVTDADVYFCSSYNPDIFKKHVFLKPYSWQKNIDLNFYKEKYLDIESKFGDSFEKIVPFIPLPMVMDIPARLFSRQQQACIVSLILAHNLLKQIPRLKLKAWDPELLLLRMRFEQLKAYRTNKLQYDIVLRDALWAWPSHRLALHQTLQSLPDRKIFASLSVPDPDDPDAYWRPVIPPSELDNAIRLLKKEVEFPRPYEEMLTSSRLAVFATGKHWGSRMIAFISLLCGGPLMMDPPIFETYFPMSDFDIVYLQDDWSELGTVLSQMDPDTWCATRRHNQQVFDKHLAPLPVARYICQTIREWFDSTMD